MTFDTFIESAWNDHADRPQEVADRLAASLDQVQAASHIAPFARIATHVFGEHLGQWQRGIDVLDSLRALPAFDGGSDAAGALARSVAVLRYGGGERSAIATLSREDQVAVLAVVAAAWAGRGDFKGAIAAYEEALERSGAGLTPTAAALRALAVGGNNLAAALEEKNDRDPIETRGMLMAAEGGLTYWKLAGTWLEEERAEYRLTRSRLAAGQPAAAVESAGRCLEVCKRNHAPPFELFFAHAVVALACRAAGSRDDYAIHRAEAQRIYDQVGEDERDFCASDLAELTLE